MDTAQIRYYVVVLPSKDDDEENFIAVFSTYELANEFCNNHNATSTCIYGVPINKGYISSATGQVHNIDMADTDNN